MKILITICVNIDSKVILKIAKKASKIGIIRISAPDI